MHTIRIMLVVGTRPEAIKLVPVIKAAQASGWIQPLVVATAQHREMLDQVIRRFGIAVDIDLDLMTEGQTLAEVAARCLSGLDQVIATKRPDLVVAQGDTTTTLAAAMAAFYRQVPFAHVEAGLRTFDLDNPFPEEFNRQAIAKLAACHFAPTRQARQNLLDEGVPDRSISVTGNTGIDTLHMAIGPGQPGVPRGEIRKMLLTLHRRESFGAPLRQVGEALGTLLDTERDLTIVWPVHSNPNVREWAHGAFGGHPRVQLSGPLDYHEFVAAMVEADFILSDSGGVQEEAPAIGKPVLVLRETTERPEAVALGVARLVGTDPGKIVHEVRTLVHDPEAYARMARGGSPYGDGQAARRIISRLEEVFCSRKNSPQVDATSLPADMEASRSEQQ